MTDPRPAGAYGPADEAIRTRRSCRDFLSTPVDEATVRELLALASRSPSGSNIQPWRVRVVAGETRARLSRSIQEAIDEHGMKHFRRAWNYYPVKWFEPYQSRRRKVGWSLYSMMGIGKGDFEASERYRRRNYDFFGAPVGLIFSIHQDLETGSFMDLGIFLSAFMIAARARGLDTCPQAAFADFHTIIRREIGVPEEEIVICGMALGYADPEGVLSKLVTERATVDEFAVFSGF